MFNNLIKYPAFLLSDSFRLQRYEQKPSRANFLNLFKIIVKHNLISTYNSGKTTEAIVNRYVTYSMFFTKKFVIYSIKIRHNFVTYSVFLGPKTTTYSIFG